MLEINVGFMPFAQLNSLLRTTNEKDISLLHVQGQRYIGVGCHGKTILIDGVPGNDLGAYLDGARLEVLGNAQDQCGDTMNDGAIIIHGSLGDGGGYAMRGGKIYIRDDAGYRTGIHMKAYEQKQPLIVIGGNAGSFLGEYLAGGMIIVLGLENGGKTPAGFFCGTGMHGGMIVLRSDIRPKDLPPQVLCRDATDEDSALIKEKITEFCTIFALDRDKIMQQHFFVLVPNSANPYRQLYCHV